MLNGAPSFVNVLDALNSWQLVRGLKRAQGSAPAASIKHVGPIGAAVAGTLSESLRRAYIVDDRQLSPTATAYARARGADPVSAYGDWAALSEPVDVSTAHVLSREVSDGIVAPGFNPEALQLLGKKRRGQYVIIEVDPTSEPVWAEARDVFGLRVEQQRIHQKAGELAVWVTKP